MGTPREKADVVGKKGYYKRALNRAERRAARQNPEIHSTHKMRKGWAS